MNMTTTDINIILRNTLISQLMIINAKIKSGWIKDIDLKILFVEEDELHRQVKIIDEKYKKINL